MARYTRTDLGKHLDKINKALAKGGSPYHLEYEGRNNYIGIDLYKGTVCIHSIGAGDTPREAAAVAGDWVVSNAVAITTE